MTNIAYVVGGLLALMLAGYLNENGASPVAPIPLALLGLCGILRGFTRASGKTPRETVEEPQPHTKQAVEEVPFADEVEDAPAATRAGQKIPAKFGKPKRTSADATPPFRRRTAGSGQVALNSAKYLNGGRPGFRKGTINEATD
jgi:hypothetical protein